MNQQTAKINILLVDDENEVLFSLTRALKTILPEFLFSAATKSREAELFCKANKPEVVVLDLCIDQRVGVESGFELLQRITEISPASRIIILTGHSDTIHGVKAINLGAASFIEKPADLPHLCALIRDGVFQSRIRRQIESQRFAYEEKVLDLLVGESAAIKRLREEIRFAASNDLSTLLQGETGTGKSECAKIIHKLSSRKDEPFVCYQPTFSSADIVNSELFGHVSGSFTGANHDRKGLIAESDNGTFFLDEIDQLPYENQVRLLGVMQHKQVRALGSNSDKKVDFRLIVASNHPLHDIVRSGKFREDLFHRVAQQIISIPPLRERREDIPLIAEQFLKKLRQSGKNCANQISGEGLNALSTFSFPGNIRQLLGVIERGAYRASFEGHEEIMVEDFGFSSGDLSLGTSGDHDSFHDAVRAFKLAMVKNALESHGGNQVQAAKSLKLDRSTMLRILKG